jgi:hypothetical protein
MEIKTCRICGRQFTSSVKHQICCSEACAHKNKINWINEYQKKQRRLARIESERKPRTKPAVSLTEAVIDLEEYNRTHGTHYSYGQAVAKGII